MTTEAPLFTSIIMQSLTELHGRPAVPLEHIDVNQITVTPRIDIHQTRIEGGLLIMETSPMKLSRSYTVTCMNIAHAVEPGDVLNQLQSDKKMGSFVQGAHRVFRLFAPRAVQVDLMLYKTWEDKGHRYGMTCDSDGVWEFMLDRRLDFKYYGYAVQGPDGPGEAFDSSIVVGDPCGRAVATQNDYLHRAKTLILPDDDFAWEGDTWTGCSPEDLIVYEMHVRDMTIHPSSDVRDAWRGTYLGLTQKSRGGLRHLKKLGVNAVELLPVQEFANYEVDYQNPAIDVHNYWNPYARNHWGYMTSYFFAPESYYATGNSLKPGEVCGKTGNAVGEMKQFVKVMHQNKISVIMDVVYNHVSQYDLNPFKYIDKKYYFRLDDQHQYLSESYCGNDFKTERPMVRKLIVDSLKYWMTEFHIDGFRFDLAGLIDDETLDAISVELRRIHPGVILIAEPWGGSRYDLNRFSIRGWSVWNDQFRNGIKGQNAHENAGFIFGRFANGDDWNAVKRYLTGSTRQEGGPLELAEHSINYIESHDDLTLADFIRIASREFDPHKPVPDVKKHTRLTSGQLRISKLAALTLMTSQGGVMLHAGQEFGRSKVIASTPVSDAKVGYVDHDTYNKDDETNWIDYDQVRINKELFAYYQGLIRIRKKYAMLRKHNPGNIHCWGSFNTFGFAMHLVDHDGVDVLILLNGHMIEPSGFELPAGQWTVIADERGADLKGPGRKRKGHIDVPPVSGMILTRKMKT